MTRWTSGKRPLEFSCEETDELQSSHTKLNCNCLLFGLSQIPSDIAWNIVTKTAIPGVDER